MKEITEIREVQNISLKLLEKFDVFCTKHGLHYFLGWGTLLGAIRHKGFIPWDDDIDIMMPRNDFDKIVEMNITEPSHGVRFYSHDQDNGYDNINCRFSDESTIVDLSKIENPVQQGIWLTIFPIDALPDAEGERTKFLRAIYLRYKLVLALSMKDEYLDTKVFWERYGAKTLKRCIGIKQRKKIYRGMHQLMRKFNGIKTNEVGILSIGTGRRTHFSRSCIEKSIMTEFEGKQFPIPVGYEEILANTYGDYMKLPPENERTPKHDFIVYLKGETK